MIDDAWVDYIIRNREILLAWTRFNLIGYLQDRNPLVPGMADKILPPCSRNLTRVKKYWDTIILVDGSLRDIYEQIPLSGIFISIDHFIPWQYVAHDELWNLSPTTQSINSSKGNKLPNWKTYFDELVELEYKAYELKKLYPVVKKEFEKCAQYHINNPDVRQALYMDGLDKDEFGKRLYNVVRPEYESAKKCGFREW